MLPAKTEKETEKEKEKSIETPFYRKVTPRSGIRLIFAYLPRPLLRAIHPSVHPYILREKERKRERESNTRIANNG
jgi:hypothetical protein